MQSSIVLLALIAVLLLVLGIVGIGAIYFLAHRCRYKSDNTKAKPTDQSVDPWEEAGRRQQ